jgi:phosphate transport system ATP-binding protein
VTLQGLRAFYGEAEQVRGVDLEFRANEVTAIIGPSGCGKSTMVRCINRMHEEIPGARAAGKVLLDELDVYDPSIDVVAVRRAIGMVFQKPNPFPTMSVFDNVAAGLRLTSHGRRGRSKAGQQPKVKPPCAAPACGTRSPTGCTSPARDSPAASSSGCASPARSRSIPR